MYSHRKHCDRFDVIDLDPGPFRGSSYLDTAMHGLADGGLLMVTSSDLSISEGGYSEISYRTYGAVTLKVRRL